MPFRNMRQIRRANAERGDRWFEPPTLRFFGSRVHDPIYGGRYFVTSEQDPQGQAFEGQRRYTVRKANDDGSIETVGEFMEHASRAAAHQAARRLAESDPQGGPAGPREGNE